MPIVSDFLKKKENGRYFTERNPFAHPAFLTWAQKADLRQEILLEPFAGRNDIVAHLSELGLCGSFRSFDLDPASPHVRQRDTIASFPEGYSVCVTNPPWLARNIATFKGLTFPEGRYGNLYQFALEQCLMHCDWVAALVPESFIRAGVFRERLRHFVSITECLFTDTGHPVGLALFEPEHTSDVVVWSGHSRLGTLAALNTLYPLPRKDGPKVSFNEPRGNVGLIALDNTVSASIRFCNVEELSGYAVKQSGRHITKLQVLGPVHIQAWNLYLNQFRKRTRDVFMTCYKGIRKDRMYRRRLDWRLARGIIHNAQAS